MVGAWFPNPTVWETHPLSPNAARCGLTNPQHFRLISCFLKQVLREIPQIENEKEPKGMKGVISRKYSILGFILFLIVLNVILLLSRQNYDYHGAYLNLVVALMLLITLRTISQKAVG